MQHAAPRWYFEPGERFLGRMVQRHMLEAYAAALVEDHEEHEPGPGRDRSMVAAR
jgi:hypothetical protein